MKPRQNSGIKSMRRVSGKEPTYKCDNCKCMRYSPCTCTRTGFNITDSEYLDTTIKEAEGLDLHGPKTG